MSCHPRKLQHIQSYNQILELLSSKDKEVSIILQIELKQQCLDSKVIKDYILSYISTRIQNPEDFDEFWEKNIEEARKTKLTYTSKYIEEYSKNGFDTYLLKIRTDSKHYIYAYLTKPQDSGTNKKYPVVFHPPGAGVKQIYRNEYYAKNSS